MNPPFFIPLITVLIRFGIGAIIIAMIVRMFASWFRLDERYAFIRFLAYITDPFIVPVRRLVPPVGVIDVSFFIAFFLLQVVELLLLQGLPNGW